MESGTLFQLTRLLVISICRVYFRIEYRGLENVPSDGPMILAPNHVSYLDPLWVSAPITRQMRYMTWERITRLPLIGPLIRYYGAFPVKLNQGDRYALRISLEHLRSGGSLVIFPEGARTKTGRLQQFKPGVVRLAVETRVPVVPVTIIGGYDAFSPHHSFPRPFKLRVVYHPPVEISSSDIPSREKEHLQEHAERLQSIVASALPPESLPLPGQTAIES
ncbi:MAG: 1-acyl-sn-glycerol-3-phosphate acyltransferase [Acidobacteriota bacterium]|nr:MAG: 1-acyl-sn-glycerol-3-phosphate acyltransferase [Acidobacteriota bacterium]